MQGLAGDRSNYPKLGKEEKTKMSLDRRPAIFSNEGYNGSNEVKFLTSLGYVNYRYDNLIMKRNFTIKERINNGNTKRMRLVW